MGKEVYMSAKTIAVIEDDQSISNLLYESLSRAVSYTHLTLPTICSV